jgi:hypothetical protein
MSRFFFDRSPAPEVAPPPREPEEDRLAPALKAVAEIQSITASAIFAALVSKGVLTAEEAAAYMAEIAGALETDVRAAPAADAARLLRSYGEALAAAAD